MTDEDGRARAEWLELARRELKGRSPDELRVRTPEGIELEPLYTRSDIENQTQLDGLPGCFPFLRGPRATMYPGRPWTVRQYAGFSTAEETNAFYRQALASGQKGLSVAFDLATHRGYDSDHPRVLGDVGKAGVAIDSVEDMLRLFEGIPLEQTSVSMTMNGAVLPVMACFIVAAEEQGVRPEALTGTIQNDILKEFMVRNTFIYPPAPSMRIVADIIEYASRHMPRFNSLSISGYHMHEAGATAELELGLTLADGLEYIRAALGKGLDIDEFAPRLSFFFAIGMDFFMEIAKLRAARMLWAKLVKERFSPENPESMRLRMHCQTSGVSLTEQDPLNNVVRTAFEALAATLGGTQSLHTNAFDEALALPSEASARLARNTQLVLAHELGITRVIDPLGGSFFVESLTEAIAARALDVVIRMEGLGGMTRAVEIGEPQRLIAEAAVRKQARIDSGQDVIVGLNAFVADEQPAVDLRVVDNSAVRKMQVAALDRLRKTRDASCVERALRALEEAASRGHPNLLEVAVEAARARATLGEMSEALEKCFGRYQARGTSVAGVYSGYFKSDPAWRALVERVEAFAEVEGRRPRILITKLGQDGHDRGAKLMASGLADLGFDVDVGPLFQTPGEVAREAVDNDVHLVGISTQAGAHLTLVPMLIAELDAQDAFDIKVVCGGVIPPADYAELEEMGVGAVLGPGTKVLDAAARLLELLSGPPRTPKGPPASSSRPAASGSSRGTPPKAEPAERPGGAATTEDDSLEPNG